MAQFISQTGITFPVVRDVDRTYGDFGWPPAISPFPRQVVVDGNRRIVYLASEYRATDLEKALTDSINE